MVQAIKLRRTEKHWTLLHDPWFYNWELHRIPKHSTLFQYNTHIYYSKHGQTQHNIMSYTWHLFIMLKLLWLHQKEL